MSTATKAPQHLDALDRANHLRLAQSALLRKLSRNQVSLEALLDDADAVSLSFERVLAAMPHRSDQIRKGEIRYSIGAARRIGGTAGISLTRNVGSLRCDVTRAGLLAAAYDVVGQFAWVYEEDTPPKLKKRPPAKKPDKVALANREAALAKGNAVRIRRKEIKELLHNGEMTLAEALEDPASKTWPIGKLVVHVPRMDPVTGLPSGYRSSAKSHMALRRLHISPLTKVGELPSSKKASLVVELGRTLTLGQATRRKVAA